VFKTKTKIDLCFQESSLKSANVLNAYQFNKIDVLQHDWGIPPSALLSQ